MFGERKWRIAGLALISAGVLTAVAWCRSYEYDEAYSIFLTAGVARPEWPAAVFRAGDVRGYFGNGATLVEIGQALRDTDVHPPLYFWALAMWRAAVGNSWVVARMFSVLCGLAGLGCVAWIARLLRIPVVAAVLMTLGCYGFAYTAAIARNFALAESLSLAGIALALNCHREPPLAAAWRPRGQCVPIERSLRRCAPRNDMGAYAGWYKRQALGCGLALGAAMAVNYLASFIAIAAFSWLAARRRWQLVAVAILGWSPFFLLDLWFFLAQRSSRQGQFPPFRLWSSMARLLRCYAAALSGGIPLYMPQWASEVTAAVLGVGLLALALMVIRYLRRFDEGYGLLVLCAITPAAGVLALGLMFNSTPIEIRYLSFGVPFCTLLVAAAWDQLQSWRRWAAAGGVASVQAVSILGLIGATATMQGSRNAAEAASLFAGENGVVLVSSGNDGVGVPGPFLAQLPGVIHVLVVRPKATQAQMEAALEGANWIVVPDLSPDKTSQDAVPTLRMLAGEQCWQGINGTGGTLVLRRLCHEE